MTCSNIESVSTMRCGFHRLPEEMVLKVFSYLSPETLICQVSRVCRQWRNLHTNPGLYRRLELTKQYPKTTSGAVKMLEMAPLITTLYILHRKDTNAILDCLVEQLAKNKGHLKTLVVYRCAGDPNDFHISSASLLDLLHQSHELQELSLYSNLSSNGPFLKDIGQLLPKLKSFELGQVFHNASEALLGIANRPNAFPFTSLSLGNCNLTDTFTETFDIFCKRFQHTLQKVDFGFSNVVTDVTLKSLARCHNVTTIKINGCDVTDDGLMELSVMPNVNTLGVWHANKVTKNGWIRFFDMPHVKNICHLQLVMCANVANYGCER